MKLKASGSFGLLIAASLAISVSQSCVHVDNTLGSSLIPMDQQYEIHTVEFDIEDIQLRMLDSLSGFSNTRMTLGSIRDEDFGLSTRTCALTLVPIADTLDFGKNPEFRSFHFTVAKDTISCSDENNARIIQNINVYELSEPLDFTASDFTRSFKHGDKRITKGIPVYNGSDSLSFDFNRAFGEKYMQISLDDLKDMDSYLKKYPGIVISTDDPVGNGGRINMFQLQLGLNTDYGSLTKDYAKLSFSGEYNGVRKDSSFFFILSADNMYNLDSLAYEKSMNSSYKFPQFCFNTVTHESAGKNVGRKGTLLYEGGAGLKPVVPAEELIRLVRSEIAQYGDPSQAIINKASIILPFEFPEDYKLMYQYPLYLSPTCRLSSSEGVTYASISNSSSKTDDQGQINRSTLTYSPDITFHLQKLLSLKNDADISNYDVWFLPMSMEISKEESSSSNSMNDYYSALSYMNYMNMMYGGYGGYGSYGYGYGGYGGYGYDSYGYNNYMSYYLMSMYASGMNSNTNSSSSTVSLDKDRFFKAVLNAPGATNGRTPKLKVIYSVPKK